MKVISWKNEPIFTKIILLLTRQKTQFRIVKGIINASDHMELCLVINLTIGGKGAISWLPIFATGYICLFCHCLLYHVAST